MHTTGIIHHFGHSNIYTRVRFQHIYICTFPLLRIPLASPFFLLTWHPPDVIGIVHLGPRLLVNCSLLSPIAPLHPPLQIPNPPLGFPEPNVHLIRRITNPLPSIQNTPYLAVCSLETLINWKSVWGEGGVAYPAQSITPRLPGGENMERIHTKKVAKLCILTVGYLSTSICDL
jgi:hypothetical protein